MATESGMEHQPIHSSMHSACPDGLLLLAPGVENSLNNPFFLITVFDHFPPFLIQKESKITHPASSASGPGSFLLLIH